MARGLKIWLAGNLFGEDVAAIVEVRRGYALDSGNADGCAEQAGALHPYADDANTYAVIRAHWPNRLGLRLRLQLDGSGGRCEKASGGNGTGP